MIILSRLVKMQVLRMLKLFSYCLCLCQVLEGRPIFVDCYGNLSPLAKAGQQLVLNFYAFKENRLPFCVKVQNSMYRLPQGEMWH